MLRVQSLEAPDDSVIRQSFESTTSFCLILVHTMNSQQSILFNESSSLLTAASPAIRRGSSRYASRLGDSLDLTGSLMQSTIPSDQSVTLTNMSSVFMSESQASNTLLGGSGHLSLSRSGHNMSALIEEDESTFQEEEDETCGTLYQQFLEAQQKYHIEEDIFDLTKEYESICCDHLLVLDRLKQHRIKRGIGTGADSTVSAEALRMLQLERNSWRLTRSLYSNRVVSPPEDLEMVVDENKTLSDRQVIDSLYERSSRIRQLQLLVDCLELNFQDDMQRQENEENINFFSEGPNYWENTLHQANTKRLKVWEEQPIRMDPDAVFRNPTDIHELDREDESRVMRFVFRYIRSGQLQEGKELAQKLGYHWLAAVLEGWILHHDPNLVPEEVAAESGERLIPDGNPRRDIWKYVCWSAAASTKGMSVHEKAIFGSLSGNVKATLPACPGWQDKLWAFTKASIDAQIEQELRTCQIDKPSTSRTGAGPVTPNVRASVDLPTEYWANAKTVDDIFRELEGLLSDYEWSVEERIHFLIQKFIITDEVDSALETMAVFIRTLGADGDESKLRPQIIRFFAHFALFYRTMGLIDGPNRQTHYNTIVEAYVNYLIDKKQIGLVAFYVSKLPEELQVFTYSKFLSKIKDKAERKKCLSFAKDAGLDVESMTRSVVESMRETTAGSPMETTSSPDVSLVAPSSTQTDESDAQLINSLEWLSIGVVQYIEILKQGNALMRTFVLSGKVEAAKEVLRRFPTDLTDGVQRSWKRKTGSQDLSLELKNLTKEYLSFVSLFCALESFNDWLRYFNDAKPRQPEKPKSNKFTDKVAFDHMSLVYESELEQWKSVLSKLAKTTADKIYQILLFDAGWMRDAESRTSSRREQEVTRMQELSSLRKTFIPEIVSILHTVLHRSGRYQEAIQIADTIACEQLQLHQEFTSQQIEDLLRKIRESAIAAISEGYDSFGYPTGQTQDEPVECATSSHADT